MSPTARHALVIAALTACCASSVPAMGQDPAKAPPSPPAGDGPRPARPPAPPGGNAPGRPGRPQGLRAEMQAARREFELLSRALTEIAGELPPEVVERAREVGAGFQERVDAWREAHAEDFKALEERMRGGGGLDADALRTAARLRDSMPRFSELRDGILSLLDEASRASLERRIEMLRAESDAAGPGRAPRRPAQAAPEPPPAAPPVDSPTRKGDGKPSGR
jgi:hypothetical protein